MVRSFVVLFLLMLAIGMTAIWFLRPPSPLPARFAHDDCRRIELIDRRSGRPIVGAEDLALAPDGDTVIISAHDRRDPARPGGGLHRLSLWSLGAGGPAEIERLDAPRSAGSVFRPHGIALDGSGRQLAVINRVAPGVVEIETGPFGTAEWRPDQVVRGAHLCRANDIDFDGSGLRVTLDRADCHFSLGDISPWSRTGSVIRTSEDGIEELRGNLAFANGLSGDAIAETRAHRLVLSRGRSIDLPGGPDNLTQTEDGDIVAALHPNLFRLAVVLRGWLDAGPSRIVRVDPGNGAIEVLFDDPEGFLFSSATSAVFTGEILLAGSVVDRGLLLCGEGV